MKKAYLYARTSTARQQKEDRQSIDSQLAQGRDFLKHHPEYELQGHIIDAASAYSGSHLDAGLGEFIRQAEQGLHVDSLLVVVFTDRLTRLSIDDAFTLLKRLAVAKVNLAITSLGALIRYNDQLEFGLRMTLTSLFHLSHQDSSIKSKRVRLAFEERAKKIHAGQKHIKTAGIPSWIEVVDGEYHLDPEKAKTIAFIFEQKVKGLGAWRIAKLLAEMKTPPFSAKGWTRAYVQNVLQSPSTYGAYQVFKTEEGVTQIGTKTVIRKPAGEPVPDYYPAAISKEVFDAAQYAISLTPAGRHSTKNPFRGLFQCHECGKGMSLCSSGKNHQYLRCNSQKEPFSRTCTALSIRFDVAKQRIMKAISKVTLPQLASVRPDESALKGQISDLDTSLARYHRLLASTKIDSVADDAIARIEQYTIQKQELEKELHRASATAPDLAAYDVETNPQEFNQAMLDVFEYITVDRRYMSFKLRGFYGNDWEPALIDWDAGEGDETLSDYLEFVQMISTHQK